MRLALLVLLLLPTSGCTSLGGLAALHGAAPTVAPIENPMLIVAGDPEILWNQVVDTVDDYFRIRREHRVQVIGGILTEGRLETLPTAGSTLLEPWRRDSTPGYERLHSTLQSIRRHALVRVMPTEAGYLVEVLVFKELEDLNHPEQATVGEATLYHGLSLAQRGPVSAEEEDAADPIRLGWIPLGRDISLEQQILAELRARLSGLGT